MAKNQEFVVTVSEIDKYLQHKNHILSIQVHKKRKKDLLNILIGWFESDFHETVTYAREKKVEHCSECGTPFVQTHPASTSCKKGVDS